ncbi:hypothetical protein STEG23_007062 [Scotinomys teguina]
MLMRLPETPQLGIKTTIVCSELRCGYCSYRNIMVQLQKTKPLNLNLLLFLSLTADSSKAEDLHRLGRIQSVAEEHSSDLTLERESNAKR